MLIPEVKRKQRKAQYKKPEVIKLLENLADADARTKHPTMRPEHIAPRKYRDENENDLIRCVVQYKRFKGGFASRISNQGTFNKKLNKFILGTSQKGLADVMATYRGKSLHIEVKIGRDKQSEAQMKIEKEVTASKGIYFIAHNFTEFKDWFDTL